MAKIQKSFPAYISKAEGDQGIVGAFTSIFGNVDYGWDVIVYGAFARTINNRAHKIRVLDNHNSWSAMDAIGRIITIQEVPREGLPLDVQAQYPDATGGLYVEIQFMLDDEISKGIFNRIKTGVIDEYSIGFEIIEQEYRTVQTDEGERGIRFIKEIKLYEVSPVIFAMNDATTTVSAKNKAGAGDSKAKPEMPEDMPDGMPMRMATGADMCANCKLYGMVTEERGWCQHHKMATASGMMCDDYETTQKRLAQDAMKEAFVTWMAEQTSTLIELGAWTENDKERMDEMMSTLSDAFFAMLPKDMSEREIPVPATLTMPKSLPQDENQKDSTPDPIAQTQSLELERKALEAAAQIRARMLKKPA